MTKQNMIDKIYDTIADKELKFGCKVKIWDEKRFIVSVISSWPEECSWIQMLSKWYTDVEWELVTYDWDRDMWIFFREYEIIWNLVLIWDVLDYLQSNNFLSECIEILWVRNNKRKPLDEQSTELISFVYDLIQTIK